MNPEELQKNIALYYSKLPPKAQEMFSSMKWLETLRGIGLKYSLSEKQKETLGIETTLVLLGIIHLNEYREALTKELALPEGTLQSVLTEINDSVLQNIQPELVDTFNANVESLAKEGSSIETSLDERFKKLPPQTQNILIESNYRSTLYNIAKKYNLNVEQIGILDKVTTDLIVGALHPDAFQDSLQGNLKLPADKTRELTNEINEKIFREIREKTIALSAKPLVVKTTLDKIKPITPPRVVTLKDIIADKKETLPVPEKLELEEASGIHPILAQKLSSTLSQIPKVETDHSIPNLSSGNNIGSMPVVNSKPAIDPYREIPE